MAEEETPIFTDGNALSARGSISYATEYDGLPASVKSNCVAFARYKVPSLPSGLWSYQDKVNIINSHVARVGAIAITKGNSSYGHVAYVEAVNGNNVTTLNGGWEDGSRIGRWTGTESQQKITGYWYPAGLDTSVSTSWSEWVDGVSETNANIYGKIAVGQRVQFTGAGVSIWDESGNLIHQSTEGTKVNYNYMQISYNIQSELGVTLSAGHSYTYQMFADFGGKRYYGNKKTFTTSGSKPNTESVNVSWSEWVDGVSQTNAVIYGKINTSQSVQFTGAGVTIWNAAGNQIHQSSESTGVNYNYMQISYNLQSELGVILSAGQSYTYQMFADFGGKRYYGNKKTFTTLPGTTNSDSTKVVTPNPTLKSTQKGQIRLSWSRYNSSDKYQIQYCRNSFFIGAGKKNTKANDYTLVNLKSKGRYYVRVRSYRKIGNKNVYSAWSKVKSIKVK